MPSVDDTGLAIVTPSYGPDLSRCQLLVESLRRFAQFDYRHYIIVSAQERSLFEPLAGHGTRVVTTDQLFPVRLEPIPERPGRWRTGSGRAVSGWIVQQLAKIAFAEQADECTLLFVDSDVAFVRPFDESCFLRNSGTRFFRVDSQYVKLFEPWYEIADLLLGVTGYVRGTRQPNYIGSLVAWDSSIASRMCRRVQAIAGESWFDRLLRLDSFSEYTLYGVFVDKCLLGDAAHFIDSRELCHCHWRSRDMGDEALDAFFGDIGRDHVAVMLTARANIDPARYRHLIDRLEGAA